MDRRVKLIFNHHADNGRGWRIASSLQATIEHMGGAEWTGTEYPTHATQLALEAANQGFEPSITLAGEVKSDVDVGVAVEIVKAAYNDDVDIIALGSRDADYLPAINVAKSMGKKILIIGATPGFSKALQHSADYIELLSVNGYKKRRG